MTPLGPGQSKRERCASGSGEGRRWTGRERAFRGGDRQRVDEVVHRITAVALHPLELRRAFDDQFDQRLPQIDVGDRLALGVLPPVGLPLLPPLSCKPLMTYVESETIVSGPSSERRASRTAMISIR